MKNYIHVERSKITLNKYWSNVELNLTLPWKKEKSHHKVQLTFHFQGFQSRLFAFHGVWKSSVVTWLTMKLQTYVTW